MTRGCIRIRGERVYARVRFGKGDRVEARLPWASTADATTAAARAYLMAQVCDELVRVGCRDLCQRVSRQVAEATTPEMLEAVRESVADIVRGNHVCGMPPLEPPTCRGVYFVQSYAPMDRAIKIGWGENIRRRLDDLRAAHPWPLHLMAFIPDADRLTESTLHRRFRSLRLDGAPGREWFALGYELISEIRELRSRSHAVAQVHHG